MYSSNFCSCVIQFFQPYALPAPCTETNVNSDFKSLVHSTDGKRQKLSLILLPLFPVIICTYKYFQRSARAAVDDGRQTENCCRLPPFLTSLLIGVDFS